MDSKLEPVVRAALRITEPVDTQHAIRREDPAHDKNRRPPRDDKQSAAAPAPDAMTISVPALLALLQDLLTAAGQIIPVPAAKTPPPSSAPATDKDNRPPDPLAARAAQAYRHAGGKPRATPPPVSTTATTAPPQTPLSAEEIRHIHELIALAERLAARDIAALSIEPQGDLLPNLRRAAKAALSVP